MTPAQALPELLTAEALAAVLNCTVDTVEDRARRGEYPGIKPGRGWIFPRAAVLQVLNAQALENVSRNQPPAPGGPNLNPTCATPVIPRGRRRNAPPSLN